MKNRLLIILFAMLLSWYSFAQDDQDQPDDQSTQVEVQEQTIDAEASENSENTAVDTESSDDSAAEEEAPGRFIPSEQISQDLGVSFPVDI